MSQPSVSYYTDHGRMLLSTFEDAYSRGFLSGIRDGVDLILTSPPFPLNTKKAYGNRQGSEYLAWLQELAPLWRQLLSDSGSLVIELGNAWEQGKPEMSTLPTEALLEIKKAGDFHVCQQFVCHNPARLPGPVEWVNKRRIRVKDSYTHIWWFSPTPYPKADNRNALIPYGADMKKLIEGVAYNAGERPSGWDIGSDSFRRDNGGAIPPSALTQDVLEGAAPEALLSISNTRNGTPYDRFCRDERLPVHPARMQPELAAFFIRFLTEEGDLVLDPFAGSNTTGAVAEALNREWIAIEPDLDYADGSKGWFLNIHEPR